MILVFNDFRSCGKNHFKIKTLPHNSIDERKKKRYQKRRIYYQCNPYDSAKKHSVLLDYIQLPYPSIYPRTIPYESKMFKFSIMNIQKKNILSNPNPEPELHSHCALCTIHRIHIKPYIYHKCEWLHMYVCS